METTVSEQSDFPLKGVIGVVANSADEINLARKTKLGCIELRADLLLDAGVSESGLFDCVRQAKNLGLAVLFTLRHPTHGGTFQGSEMERVKISLKAVEAGADLFDLEFDSEAAAILPDNAPPMILSYHDFNGMPSQQKLHDLTEAMQSTGASAIKVVPTASTLEDALTMLQWVGQDNGVSTRIGFAMGEEGACSRILTTALGGAVTYASFGAPVAPGQIAIDELVSMYRVDALNDQCQVTAVCADGEVATQKVVELNQSFDSNQIAVGFKAADKALVEKSAHWMRVDDVVFA